MARTFIGAGRRRSFTPTLRHLAGDLVYKEGFFGVSWDDAVFTPSGGTIAARPFVQILDGEWDLPANLAFATAINPGNRLYGDPTYSATSVKLYPEASAAAGAKLVGRVWATAVSGASLVRAVLFGPENQG